MPAGEDNRRRGESDGIRHCHRNRYGMQADSVYFSSLGRPERAFTLRRPPEEKEFTTSGNWRGKPNSPSRGWEEEERRVI
jgi:hypothetical protein